MAIQKSRSSTSVGTITRESALSTTTFCSDRIPDCTDSCFRLVGIGTIIAPYRSLPLALTDFPPDYSSAQAEVSRVALLHRTRSQLRRHLAVNRLQSLG